MPSFPQALRRAAPAVHAVFPALVLLMVLSGCATSDSVPKASKFPGGTAAGTTRFWVNMSSRPHLEAAPAISDFGARGQFVMDELRRNAAASQGGVISFLQQRNVKFEAFWVANTIWVEADEETRKMIADLPGVASIEPEVTITLDEPQAAAPSLEPQPATTLTIEPNVSRVHAPEVWDMGTDGTGIVVGVMDTGFAPHPAITPRFRGFKNTGSTFNNNYNWYSTIDASTSACKKSPCDGNGHGTHVAGTILGRDGTNAIGVAPGAQFIACRALNDSGVGTAVSLMLCLQWFLAPTDTSGQNPKPDMRPQIISQSLGASGLPTGVAEATSNLVAAGTLSVAAAGNSGGCGKIGYPAALSDVLAVGALTADATTNTLSSYSSSGPVPNSPDRIKPDVVAQGDAVRSAWLNNAYRSISGTSMATPAVSGVAALVMSARPQWIGHPADVAELLRRTANSDVRAARSGCGNAAGFGLVDAHAAVLQAEEPPPRKQ